VVVKTPMGDGHLEHVRRFKRHLAIYLLALVVLTPIWVVTQYETADGWLRHLSTRSRYPGDWDPWIIWVAAVGAVLVTISGVRAYRDRPGRPDGTGRQPGEPKAR
jgi:hypothetical protein